MEKESITFHHCLCDVRCRGPSWASRHISCSSRTFGDAKEIGERWLGEVSSKPAMEGNILVDLCTEVGSLKGRDNVRHDHIIREKITDKNTEAGECDEYDCTRLVNTWDFILVAVFDRCCESFLGEVSVQRYNLRIVILNLLYNLAIALGSFYIKHERALTDDPLSERMMSMSATPVTRPPFLSRIILQTAVDWAPLDISPFVLIPMRCICSFSRLPNMS